MILFNILRQPVTISVSLFQSDKIMYVLGYCEDAAKQREEIKECLTTVKHVFFSYTNGGILSRY